MYNTSYFYTMRCIIKVKNRAFLQWELIVAFYKKELYTVGTLYLWGPHYEFNQP